MNILQVVPYMYPAWSYGGPTKLVYELSLSLSELQNTVTVMTTDAFDGSRRMNKNEQLPSKDTFRVVYFRNISNFLAYNYRLFTSLGMIPYLIFRISTFDIVHIHDFFNIPSIAAACICIYSKTPFVFSVHGTLGAVPIQQKSLVKKLFLKTFGKFLLTRASGVFAHSKQEVQEYESVGYISPQKIRYIPSGLRWQTHAVLPPKGVFRKIHAISDKEILILYLGRIHRLKGIDLLVQAFAGIKEKKYVRLVIAGSDNGYLTELKELIKSLGIEKKVLFLGITAGKEKLELYRDVDIAVFPTYVLACPLTFMANQEMMAAGLPLITTGECNQCELKEAEAGLMVKPNVDEIRSAIELLLANSKKRNAYGEHARKLIKDRFTWETNSKIYQEVYRNICVE